MLRNFKPRQPVAETHFELVFSLDDGRKSAFHFACNDAGQVFRASFSPLELASYEHCLSGVVDGFTIGRGTLGTYVHSYVADGRGVCSCGHPVVVDSVRTNTCKGCRRHYSGSGQLLTERLSQKKETGETFSDLGSGGSTGLGE